jgi:hypothetical protein
MYVEKTEETCSRGRVVVAATARKPPPGGSSGQTAVRHCWAHARWRRREVELGPTQSVRRSRPAMTRSASARGLDHG